ncbi:MAG TPA: molybdopterin-dependent oxidoreductase [Actinomycetota bacterium]
MDANVDAPRSSGVVLGLVTAAVAIGAAQVAAAFVDPQASPIVAVGHAVIDATPGWLERRAIRTFGSADKLVLVAGIALILGVAAAALGIVAMRRVWIGVAGLAALTTIGIAAAAGRPASEPVDAVPAVVGGLAGAATLLGLREIHPRDGRSVADPRDPGRRRFLALGMVGGVAAAFAGGIATVLADRSRADASRAAVRIPRPASRAAPVPGADLGVEGLGPFHTPNDVFYRIDTALLVPSLEADAWRLRVHGAVDRELVLTYADLLARPLIERDITLACVSNPVGGPYVGNARWIGAPLRDLLEEAGVRPGADQLVSRSSDGFTIGTPTAVVTDGRDAILAVAMNGEPLPVAHGFPVRMVVPGLYGYVSATKWVVDLELTTFDAYDAYWVRRGWAERAPVETMARIDTPTGDVTAGVVPVAGVAWAQHRGIERVELRVDGGPWVEADLAPAGVVDAWRQWVVRWDADPGDHVLEARATDGTGAVQTEEPSPPFPDGATGYHRVTVRAA